MRQEDLDKLTKRVSRMVRDMIEPDMDYRVILIVGERHPEGIRLSLGSNAQPDLAAMLCEIARDEYASRVSKPDIESLVDAIHRVVDALAARLDPKEEPEPSEPLATKH